jgi:hypothetical protein
MTSLADQHEREEAFINASDRDRLVMLANGQAQATDRVQFLADQTLAREILNQKLGAPPSSALPYKK